MSEAATIQDRPTWGRGVLASYVRMTARSADDASKFKITLRDGVLLLAGMLTMYGALVSREGRIEAAVTNIDTKLTSYQQEQANSVSYLQQQLNEQRAATKLATELAHESESETAELKGMMEGAGIIKQGRSK